MFSEPQIIFPAASEGESFTWLQNQRTGAGGVGGGGLAEDRRRRKEIHREKEGERGDGREGGPERQDRKMQRGVPVRVRVCAQCVCMCWRVIMKKAWDKTTDPVCPLDQLKTQIPIFTRHLQVLIHRLPLIFVFPF